MLKPSMARLQRGLSLVELMVGMAIGMVVVAGAAMMTSTQMAETRKLLLETQMQQDLRAAADIITREIRRSGSWAYDDLAGNMVWNGAVGQNPYSALAVNSTSPQISYAYYRNAAETAFGFRLNTNTGALQHDIVGGGYQDLTDTKVMEVTAFNITQTDGPSVVLPCPNDCPTGAAEACWPKVRTRQVTIEINGQSRADPNVRRSLSVTTDLRNDVVIPYLTGQMCP